MTQIEIVDLLKESGVWDEIGYPTCIDKLIDLVAAHEREKQAEQEPVAWGCRFQDGSIHDCICPESHAECEGDYNIPLYAAPVRTKDLTDDEIEAAYEDWYESNGNHAFPIWVGARAVIAAYKEKNK